MWLGCNDHKGLEQISGKKKRKYRTPSLFLLFHCIIWLYNILWASQNHPNQEYNRHSNYLQMYEPQDHNKNNNYMYFRDAPLIWIHCAQIQKLTKLQKFTTCYFLHRWKKPNSFIFHICAFFHGAFGEVKFKLPLQ